MKATGIVRRIDDLGRVVIPKEIRRTMRIREGDPLEIYTSKEGEVVFKKYSLLGGLEDFAEQFCDSLSRCTDFTAAVTDRDSIIAVAGPGRRELLGKTLSSAMTSLMDSRSTFTASTNHPIATESAEKYTVSVATPILCEGDVLGLVMFLSDKSLRAGDAEQKLSQTVAGFLGRHMEL